MKIGQALCRPLLGGHSLQHWLEEDRTPKPACEMELWVQILLICSQVACILSVIALGLYIWASGTVLCWLLEGTHWVNFSGLEHVLLLSNIQGGTGLLLLYHVTFVCFGFGERWPIDGSLDYCTTMHLEQYCQ